MSLDRWTALLAGLVDSAAIGDSRRMAQGLVALRAAAANAPVRHLDEMAGLAAVHELPWVRLAMLQALTARWPHRPEVHAVVTWLTHDYDDFVAFDAIDTAGRLGIHDALPDLFLLVGLAGERIHGVAGKPVGMGHAVALRAIVALVGSESAADVANAQSAVFPEGAEGGVYEPVAPADADACGGHDHRGMVSVPGGAVRGGPPPAFDRERLVFDWDDPPDTGLCRDFRIDVVPVGNADYDRFALSAAAHRHEFCHPAEPKGKLHLRNTFLDRRSGPDHPVAGVDWFDAYAYARSLGKRLPTEAEWQRAGQGDDERAFPWGDVFDPARAHCRPEAPAPGWDGVVGWRDALVGMMEAAPPATTRPRGIPGSDSPFGVRDLAGNVWEWTASSFPGPELSPVGADRDALDVIYDHRSYAVIKGGTWSSLPEQASVAFRGRDLALDRHFEIGFRCACRCTRDGGA